MGLGGDIMPQIDLLSILAIFLAIGAVYILGMLLVLPIKLIVRLIINGIVGALALIVFNVFGSYIGVTIGVNPVTALIAGFLGIPGVLLMIFVKIFL
jgi:inhibitor of the pro-sigma K processing machinery